MDFEKQHQRNIARYQKLIQEIYDEAIIEAANIGHNVPNFDPTKPFYFANYPAVQKKIQKVLDSLYKEINIVIVDGIDAEWTLANNKNSELAKTVFGKNLAKIPKPIERKYFSNNNEAKQQFLKRKTNGMGISDRVWNYTQQYKQELELGLDIGLRNGLSAQEMSKDLRSYLKQPEKLFRRVRDEHGNLRLSKSAKAYNPGQGVYRSSYKNSMRLTATETNMAYRKADYERRMDAHYIVGVEVKLSNNHTLNGVAFTDICDELKGKYPKDFVFTGWHPFCRCYTVDVLITEEEMDDYYDALDRGEKPKESVNQVNHTPQQFNDWVKENKTRIDKSKSLPYFVKDNQKYMNPVKKTVLDEKAKPVEKTVGFTKAKSIKEANDWAYKNLDVKFVDYNGLDLEVANDMNKAFYNMKQVMPNIKTNGIGSAQKANKALRDELIEGYKDSDWYKKILDIYGKERADKQAVLFANKQMSKVSSGVVAWSTNFEKAYIPSGKTIDISKYKGVFVNEKFGKDVNIINSIVKKNELIGFYTKGAKDSGYIISHEIGHEIDKTIGFRLSDEFKEIYKRELRKGMNHMIENLSKYGATAGGRLSHIPHEFIAESWAEYITSANPRPIAKEIGEAMIKRYYDHYLKESGLEYNDWKNNILKTITQ